MRVAAAGFALFLDVGDFPARRHLTIPAHDAPAAQCREPQKPNQTHRTLRRMAEQYMCRKGFSGPLASVRVRLVHISAPTPRTVQTNIACASDRHPTYIRSQSD